MNKLNYLLLLMFLPLGVYAETRAASPQSDFTQTLVMIGVALLFFYIILWRPEQKRKKQLDDARSNLKKGDKVTAMGIIGTVEKIQEHTVVVKMYDGALVEFVIPAIAEVHS